jgi:hypothetical protein
MKWYRPRGGVDGRCFEGGNGIDGEEPNHGLSSCVSFFFAVSKNYDVFLVFSLVFYVTLSQHFE